MTLTGRRFASQFRLPGVPPQLAHSLDLRAQNEHRLPAVSSVEEIRSVLAHVKTFHNHGYLSTLYSCGLRLHEGLYLKVSDIDSHRMMIHLHRGKGDKDRSVPLPQSTLHLLRSYWRIHRHPPASLPSSRPKRKAEQAQRMPSFLWAKSSVQGAFLRAKLQAGVRKKGVAIHTLRHSYATHLLEAGVNLRVSSNARCAQVANNGPPDAPFRGFELETMLNMSTSGKLPTRSFTQRI